MSLWQRDLKGIAKSGAVSGKSRKRSMSQTWKDAILMTVATLIALALLGVGFNETVKPGGAVDQYYSHTYHRSIHEATILKGE